MKMIPLVLLSFYSANQSHAACIDFSGNYKSEISSHSLTQKNSKGSTIRISQFGCERVTVEETDNELSATITSIYTSVGEAKVSATSDPTTGLQKISTLFDDRFVQIWVNAYKAGSGITALWMTEYKKDQDGNIIVNLSNNVGAHNYKDQYMWQKQ